MLTSWSVLLGPIAASFWQNEELAAGLGKDICLDGVVCVVDSVFGEKVQFIALQNELDS